MSGDGWRMAHAAREHVEGLGDSQSLWSKWKRLFDL
jgi:hypothetical protein